MLITNKMKEKTENLLGSPIVTIAFLGDSVTQGCFDVYVTGPESIDTYYDVENAYHTKVRKILSMLYPKTPINIINAGICGDNAVRGAARLERDVLRYSPDLCVVCFGLNDCGCIELEDYKKSIREIFERLQEKNIETIFMTPNMMCTKVSAHLEKQQLIQIAESSCNAEVEGVLEMYLNAAKEIAEEKAIPVCDCYKKWKKLYQNGVDTTILLSNYINHPTEDMNWLFAYSLVETMFTC